MERGKDILTIAEKIVNEEYLRLDKVDPRNFDVILDRGVINCLITYIEVLNDIPFTGSMPLEESEVDTDDMPGQMQITINRLNQAVESMPEKKITFLRSVARPTTVSLRIRDMDLINETLARQNELVGGHNPDVDASFADQNKRQKELANRGMGIYKSFPISLMKAI